MSPRKSPDQASHRLLLNSKYIAGAVEANRDALRAAGVEPAPGLLASIAAYIELLLRWNRKINLTAIADPGEMVTRNFAESFLAARWLTEPEGRLCDVGSGAGFPGLALKLILSNWHVHLLEPNAKKAAFLAEAARTLGLRDVDVERSRWSESNLRHGSLDAVTARALGGYEKLCDWSRSHLKAGGRLILWLGAQDAKSLRESRRWQWEQADVPRSRERVLLIGTAPGSSHNVSSH